MHKPFFLRLFQRRWRGWLLALALPAVHGAAHADLWAFVDEQGITHFAATQVDERYLLFFKGSEIGNLSLSDASTPAAADSRHEPSPALARRWGDLDASRGYQSVRKHLQVAAKAYQVDYSLLKAVVAAESGFDPAAVSSKGAVGLMQLLPSTAAQYGVQADAAGRRDRQGRALPARSIEQKLTDPHTNIQAGARHLAHLLKLFKGELELAVAAYNAGEGAVQRAGHQIPNYKETQGYVKTVLGLYQMFQPEGAARRLGRAEAAVLPQASVIGTRGTRVRARLGSPEAPAPAGPARTEAAAEPYAALAPVRYAVPLAHELAADGRQ